MDCEFSFNGSANTAGNGQEYNQKRKFEEQAFIHRDVDMNDAEFSPLLKRQKVVQLPGGVTVERTNYSDLFPQNDPRLNAFSLASSAPNDFPVGMELQSPQMFLTQSNVNGGQISASEEFVVHWIQDSSNPGKEVCYFSTRLPTQQPFYSGH